MCFFFAEFVAEASAKVDEVAALLKEREAEFVAYQVIILTTTTTRTATTTIRLLPLPLLLLLLLLLYYSTTLEGCSKSASPSS